VQNQPRDQGSRQQLEQLAVTLSELGKEARDHGVALSLHHHYNQPVMHREEMELFFDAAQPGAIGLTVDTAHLVKSGIQDVPQIIRDFRHVIDNIHLKDYAGGNWQVLGHGDIDFDAIFAALKEIGYDGWVCADEESGGDLIQGMEECYQFMRRGLQ
jgi:sugar phosphate isomerase/epimerase